MGQKIKVIYENEVVPYLQETFEYKNIHEIPKIEKIQINRGLGVNAQNNKVLKKSIDEVRQITGQQPIVTTAKKSIAGFKLREGNAIGAKVTLRGDRMYEFLDRLINLAIPRVRDFRGLSLKSFDGNGNYTFGVTEQLIFPEIQYDKIDSTRGMDITIVTTANTDQEGRALLDSFSFPFRTEGN